MSANGPGASAHGAPPPFDIRLLGPVEVTWRGRPIDLGGAKARALVARLVIDRNLVVPVDRLVDSLWGDESDGAEIALRSTISRLRKRVRDAGATEELIVTRTPGYALEVPVEATDVQRFEQLVAEGRRQLSRRRPSEAVRLMVESQELWRGPAYSEVRDEPFARAEARRLEELLLTAIEIRIDAGLTMGRHEALVGELESLTHANPMRERLWSQRMLSLYRCGRQAEALRVFQELRSLLVAELGIEPGHDVAWMEHAILTQDEALSFPVPPEAPVLTESAPPRAPTVRIPAAQLEGELVGRERESAALARWWEAVRAGQARLLFVDGEPGIGKSRLVAELARAVAEEEYLVLWGRCDEEPMAPYQPFAEALGRYFQSVSADRISSMPDWQLTELSRLVSRLRDFGPELDEDAGEPGTGRYRFFEAVTATLDEISAGRPMLLVGDDLHWADEPTLLLLRHVLRNIDSAHLGFVGVYTDTEVPPDHRLRSFLADFRTVRGVDTVHLQGLSPAAVEQLAKAASVPPELIPRLVAMTDGNPLFLDEMLRQLRGGEEGATAVPPDLDPPQAIRELVARRVSRLHEDAIYLLQYAAVAGQQWEAGIVAEAAELPAEQRLDALDRAEESKLVRRARELGDRYAFTHALVRDAIYDELLRGRRVRYHHRIATVMERAHAGELDAYVNEMAHHFYMGAALGDADKAIRYCSAAGQRALRLLAFEEAIGHFSRSLEVAEQYGDHDQAVRCDTLVALAEAQNRAGDMASANAGFERAAALARSMGDPERLAGAAVRAGPLSYLGIVRANADQVRLLEEALAMLPEEDSHLRAMVTARLGLVLVYSSGSPQPEVLERARALNTEAVRMARRLGDRNALGYALNARMHILWGIDPAPERLAAGTELGEIADDVGDELLALHSHAWRVRELLVQGDVDAVGNEVARFAARHTGPVHPLAKSYSLNVAAMLALIEGNFATADRLGVQAMEVAEGYNDMAFSFYGGLMIWTWWQRGELIALAGAMPEVIAQTPTGFPLVRAALALIQAETGQPERALGELDTLAELGWETLGEDQAEGMSLALAAAACSAIGPQGHQHASRLYDALRPYASTAVVIRAPATACVGPADQYLGLLASCLGDHALAEVHFEAALRLATRMCSRPFVAAAEVELARTLRRRGRHEDGERIAALLRHSEESAIAMRLVRLAALAARPD